MLVQELYEKTVDEKGLWNDIVSGTVLVHSELPMTRFIERRLLHRLNSIQFTAESCDHIVHELQNRLDDYNDVHKANTRITGEYAAEWYLQRVYYRSIDNDLEHEQAVWSLDDKQLNIYESLLSIPEIRA